MRELFVGVMVLLVLSGAFLCGMVVGHDRGVQDGIERVRIIHDALKRAGVK